MYATVAQIRDNIFMAILHWETFKGGPTKPENQAFAITINHKKVLTLNKFTVKTLNNPEAVILMFDKKESVIGVVPSNMREKYAFPLKPKGGGLNFVVHTAPFCRHFNIRIDKTEKFDHPELDDQGVLRLDLKNTHDVSNRKKRA